MSRLDIVERDDGNLGTREECIARIQALDVRIAELEATIEKMRRAFVEIEGNLLDGSDWQIDHIGFICAAFRNEEQPK